MEIYVSTDIEADGPIPGPHSMVSFGSAAFLPDKTLVDTFSANLEPLPDAKPHPETMKWWRNFPDAWAAAHQNQQPPAEAMKAYAEWLKGLPGKPVFVGYPVAYDFMFIYWYLIRFVWHSPFAHSALDIKTMGMIALGVDYRESYKRNMRKEWFDSPQGHSHVALDDAIEQGLLLCNILAELGRH